MLTNAIHTPLAFWPPDGRYSPDEKTGDSPQVVTSIASRWSSRDIPTHNARVQFRALRGVRWQFASTNVKLARIAESARIRTSPVAHPEHGPEHLSDYRSGSASSSESREDREAGTRTPSWVLSLPCGRAPHRACRSREWLPDLQAASPSPTSVVVIIGLDEFAFPSFFALIDGESGDDETGYWVEPCCASQFVKPDS